VRSPSARPRSPTSAGRSSYTCTAPACSSSSRPKPPVSTPIIGIPASVAACASHTESPIMTGRDAPALSQAVVRRSGAGLVSATSSLVTRWSIRGRASRRSSACSVWSGLPEVASTTVSPLSRSAASSGCAPFSGTTSSSRASASFFHASRIRSPYRSSTSSPATWATRRSPPIPTARWIRQVSAVTLKVRNARSQAIVCW